MNPYQPPEMVVASTPVIEVIRLIDVSSLQIALVHEDGRLVGAVTDGDVRRGILRGVGLEAPVSAIMSREPVSATADMTDEAMLSLMRRLRIHQLPIVDADGRVVDVKTLDSLLSSGQQANWVVLMAGGLGTRLRPLTDERPKPLLHVGDRPILETIVRGFSGTGFSRFFISVNYRSEMIKSFFGDGSQLGVTIEYLEEENRLGTAGALSLLPERPTSPFFVMNADLLTTLNFRQMLNFHEQNGAMATVCVRDHSVTLPFGVIETHNGKIKTMREKPTHRFLVNAGIYVLHPEALDYIDPSEHLDMPDLLHRLMSGGDVDAFPMREFWMDIGHPDDLERAAEEYERIFS